jgi:hypothetical protein
LSTCTQFEMMISELTNVLPITRLIGDFSERNEQEALRESERIGACSSEEQGEELPTGKKVEASVLNKQNNRQTRFHVKPCRIVLLTAFVTFLCFILLVLEKLIQFVTKITENEELFTHLNTFFKRENNTHISN